MVDERRRSQRAETDEIAYISVSGSSTRCRIINISSDGAALEVPDASHIPDRFKLMTATDRVIRDCRIAWTKQNQIGVAFETVLDETDAITHPQRQFLQYLRDGKWRRAISLPDSTRVITRLLNNGWIEQVGVGNATQYRITQKGLVAKTTPVKF